MKDFTNTLLIPKTEFPMKANLVQKEKDYCKNWAEKKIYRKRLKLNENNESWILHDGPPYANGNLHVGHALNKILKDIIVRFKNANGFYSPYVAGWDTHGLPIELKMLELQKKNQKDFSIVELRKEAAKYAHSQIKIQKEQFSQMQLLSDLKDIYVTLDPKFEANQLKIFKKMAMEGLIFKGLKPVYWSTSSQSALAEAEVEYADHRSPSVYVSFEFSSFNDFIKKGDELIIWTTTPWTLIANAGVAVKSQFDYSRVSVNNKTYVLATEIVIKLAKFLKWEDFKIESTFKGKDIINLEYIRPIKKDKKGGIVHADHVSLDTGSGLVHMAPLFGEDDFIVGKKNKLDMIMHVSDDGTLNEHADQYAGIFYEDANKNVGMDLDYEGKLLSLKFIKHSYPHDWRTHKPIIYRGTPQWFVSIEKIKDNILSALDKVNSFPEWGLKRIRLMIENREEWTISRQRVWGVPIPIFYDENKKVVINEEIFDHVINLVEQYGSDIWFEKTVDELLPTKYQNRNWTKEQDIMDVWFDSGSSFFSVLEQMKKDYKIEKFDVYLEGGDQYRGWFNSSLINSVAFQNKSPFNQLISHGFVLDGKGNKMSKSKGNVVDPLKIIKKNGADILRLWTANSEYTSDVTIDDKIIKQNIEIYRKIRNTFKFLLGNISDFSKKDCVALTGIHALIHERLQNLKINVKKNYENFKYINVIKDVNNFIIDISSYYLSISKDTLYADKKDNKNRLMTLTNIYNMTKTIMISLYPILPTTMEEVYSYLNLENKKESIVLENFYEVEKESFVQENKWKEFFELKDKVYKLIEEQIKAGTFKRQNEAHLILKTESDFIKSLDLKILLMIGKVEFGDTTELKTFNSISCPRCWNHFLKGEMIQQDSLNEMENQIVWFLCQRCDQVI